MLLTAGRERYQLKKVLIPPRLVLAITFLVVTLMEKNSSVFSVHHILGFVVENNHYDHQKFAFALSKPVGPSFVMRDSSDLRRKSNLSLLLQRHILAGGEITVGPKNRGHYYNHGTSSPRLGCSAQQQESKGVLPSSNSSITKQSDDDYIDDDILQECTTAAPITQEETDDDELENEQNEANNNSTNYQILHTYNSTSTSRVSASFFSLGISKEKFYTWLQLSLSTNEETPTHLSSSFNFNVTRTNLVDYESITTQTVNVSDPVIRDQLRVLWKERRLICKRTDPLAVYSSDNDNKDNTNNDYESEGKMQTDNNSLPRITAKSSQRRGGFDDLLSMYAERLVGIGRDELLDYRLLMKQRQQEQQNDGSSKINVYQQFDMGRNSNGERAVGERYSSSNKNINDDAGRGGVLTSWLENEYGVDNLNTLRSLPLITTEKDQLEVLHHFLDWFRERFPYYYDQCNTCGRSSKAGDYDDDEPSNDDSLNNCNDSSNHSNIGTDVGKNGEVEGNSEVATSTVSAANNDNEIENQQENDDNEDDDGTFVGYVYPSEIELNGKASRTELYHCRKCRCLTRFPRYNSASYILHSTTAAAETSRRQFYSSAGIPIVNIQETNPSQPCPPKGRCGEYSMLMFRIMRELNLEVRWVVDWSDHVWNEVWLASSAKRSGTDACNNDKVNEGRWVHLDPCEAAVDEPLLYQGWGKEQTYIIALRFPSKSIGGYDCGIESDEEELLKNQQTITNNYVNLLSFNKLDNDSDQKEDDDALQEQHPTSTMRSTINVVNEKSVTNRADTTTSFTTLLIEDVTSQYTTDDEDAIQQRRSESKNEVISSIEKATAKLLSLLDQH